MNTTPDIRPLAERITQGLAERDEADILIVCDNAHDVVARCYPVWNGSYSANAELIAEAFNVTHETRRTPRQLADERAELIAALQLVRKSIPTVLQRECLDQQLEDLLERISP